MKKVYEEVGKGLIAFANIVTALVFVKDYFDKDNNTSLTFGLVFFVLFYILGIILIKKSEEE